MNRNATKTKSDNLKTLDQAVGCMRLLRGNSIPRLALSPRPLNDSTISGIHKLYTHGSVIFQDILRL
jgi:hypothetical protein